MINVILILIFFDWKLSIISLNCLLLDFVLLTNLMRVVCLLMVRNFTCHVSAICFLFCFC